MAVSETHLTAVSRSSVLASLRAHSQYKHIVTGAPLAPRSIASEAGQYCGVAIVSSVPSRAFCIDWPSDLFDTGRVQVVGSLVGNMWVSGAIAHGYPQSKYHIKANQRTEAMLDLLPGHMTNVVKGPRSCVVTGIMQPEQLEVSKKLQALGWRECQDLEFMRGGTPPQMTCKMKTRKDVMWLSPELVACFQGLTVQHDRFP